MMFEASSMRRIRYCDMVSARPWTHQQVHLAGSAGEKYGCVRLNAAADNDGLSAAATPTSVLVAA